MCGRTQLPPDRHGWQQTRSLSPPVPSQPERFPSPAWMALRSAPQSPFRSDPLEVESKAKPTRAILKLEGRIRDTAHQRSAILDGMLSSPLRIDGSARVHCLSGLPEDTAPLLDPLDGAPSCFPVAGDVTLLHPTRPHEGHTHNHPSTARTATMISVPIIGPLALPDEAPIPRPAQHVTRSSDSISRPESRPSAHVHPTSRPASARKPRRVHVAVGGAEGI